MKKIMLVLLVISCLGACKKEEDVPAPGVLGCMDPNSLNYSAAATINNGLCVVPIKKQNILAMEYTAKWCSPCGTWGSKTLHNLSADPDIYTIAIHQNDVMDVDGLCYSFDVQRPHTGIPYFYIGDFGPDINWTMTNGGYYVCADNTIEDYRQQTPTASSAGIVKEDGEEIVLRVSTQFYNNTSGNYYIGAYLMEDGIDGGESSGLYNQNGVFGDYKHDYVIRKNFCSNAYGISLQSSNINANTPFFNTFSLEKNNLWNIDNCYVLIVVWEKEISGFYKFININKVAFY